MLFILCFLLFIHRTIEKKLSCGEIIYINSSDTSIQYYFDSNLIEFHEDCFIKFIADKPSIISIKEFIASSKMHMCNEDHYLTLNEDCNSHFSDLKICNQGIEHIFNNFTLEFSSCLFLGMKTFKKTSNKNGINPSEHASTSVNEEVKLKLTLSFGYKPNMEGLRLLSNLYNGGLVSLITDDFVTNWQMFLLPKKDNYGGFLFTNINNGKTNEIICMDGLNYQIINNKLRIIQFEDLNELTTVKSLLRNNNQTAFIGFLNKQTCNLISNGGYYFSSSPLTLIIKVGYDQTSSSKLLYLPIDKMPIKQTVTLPSFVPILVMIIISFSFMAALLLVIFIKRRLQQNFHSYDECVDTKDSSPENTKQFIECA